MLVIRYVLAIVVLFTVSIALADIERAYKSVVRIKVQKTNSEGEKFGTGFFVNNEGQILTNYHVVKDLSRIVGVMHYANDHEYEASDITVNCYNSLYDIAVVKIDKPKIKKPVSFIDLNDGDEGGVIEKNNECKKSKIKQIDRVKVIYNSSNLKNDIAVAQITTHGPLSSLFVKIKEGKGCKIKNIDDMKYNYDLYLYEKETVAGSSGSPIVLNNGKLVAMAAGEVDGAKNFAIPVRYLKDVMRECNHKTEIPNSSLRDKFLSPVYTIVGVSSHSGESGLDQKKIKLRGRVITEGQNPLKNIKVVLYRGDNKKEVVGQVRTDAEGRFLFSVNTNPDEKWFLTIDDVRYKLVTDEYHPITSNAFLTMQDIFVKNIYERNLILVVQPKTLMPKKDIISRSGFTVSAVKKGEDMYLLKDDQFQWRFCVSPINDAQCDTRIKKSSWLTINDGGSLGVEYNAMFDATSKVLGDELFHTYDIKITEPSGLDRLRESISIYKNAYDEIDMTAVISGIDGGKFKLDVPIDVTLASKNGVIIGKGDLFDRKALTSRRLVYSLRILNDSFDDFKNLDVIYKVNPDSGFVLLKEDLNGDFIKADYLLYGFNDAVHKLILKRQQ